LIAYITIFGSARLCESISRFSSNSPVITSFEHHTNKKLTSINNKIEIKASNSGVIEPHGISIFSLVINVVADLCPHGMLPLAYGFAQGGPTGILVAVPLMLIFGIFSAYTMTSVAGMAAELKSSDIGELWSTLVSQNTKWIADLSVFYLCFGCCVFYSAFVGDIFGTLAATLGIKGPFGSRTAVLAFISSLIILPLCLTEDLSSLQFSSLLGVGGVAYTVLFHIISYVQGTYSYSDRGIYLQTITEKLKPVWPETRYSLTRANTGTLVLVNMLCVAFLAHYNAINYYRELKNASPQRYSLAMGLGFGTAFIVFLSMMFLGYEIFGTAAQPLILNNFHRSQDLLATIARVATGAAIVFAYPLMFAGLKASLFSLMPTVIRENKLYRSEAIVVAVSAITSIAFQCAEEDVSLVLGIVGSLLGCGTAYVIPAVLALRNEQRKKRSGLPVNRGVEAANGVLLLSGVVFAVLGVWITLSTAADHHH